MKLTTTIEVNNLVDIYGKLLTEKQLKIINDYYKNDYSLSEIADNLNITKQAVKYSMDLAIERLKELDEKLHLVEMKEKLNEFLQQLDNTSQDDLQQIINMIGE